MTDATIPTALDDYLFDLRGFVVIPTALTGVEVAQLNACSDRISALKPNQWLGLVHRQDHHETCGINLRQIFCSAFAPYSEFLARLCPTRRPIMQPLKPI